MSKSGKYSNIDQCNPLECISGKMARCGRIVSSVFRKHLKPFGITNSQLSILFVITKAPLSTQKILSEKLYMDKSTVNRNLKRLLDGHLILKEDKHIIRTSEKGMELMEQVIPHWEKAMAEIRNILGSDGEAAISLVQNKLQQSN